MIYNGGIMLPLLGRSVWLAKRYQSASKSWRPANFITKKKSYVLEELVQFISGKFEMQKNIRLKQNCTRRGHERCSKARLKGLLLFFLTTTGISAQNTGTVFSPDVKPGTQGFDLRFAYDEDADSLAKRFHYQYAFDDALRLRGIAAFRSDDVEEGDFRYFRLEGQYQFLEDDQAPFDSALRVELQFADGDDPPSRVRVGWSNQFNLNDAWQVRGILLTGHRFGPESSGGYLLESRAQISRELNESLTLGLDYYGDYNTTNNTGSFDNQEHQLGPVLKFDLIEDLSGMAGVLFGLSDATADREFRLFFFYAI